MSNGMNKFVVEFDIGDAPMIVRAFSIARNTAMMCGYPDAQKRFERYRAIVKQFVPLTAKLFDEEQWSLIMAKLQEAKNFTIAFTPRYSWVREKTMEDEGTIIITIGEDVFEVSKFKTPHFKLIRGDAFILREELITLAPMDCACSATGTDIEDYR